MADGCKADPPSPAQTSGGGPGEALLRDALDAIGEAFVIYGPDGRLVLCNENFRKIYGYSEEEAQPGVHFQELGRIDVERGNVVVGDEHGHGADYLARKAEYRRKLEGSFIVQLKNGRWLKTTDRATSDGGFVSVQSDVTELKQAEAKMAAAKAEAERSSRAKSEFLAKMSHELRTPLNSILGFSELLARDALGPAEMDKVRSYARTIHHSGTLLLQLIDEILDLSRIEAGKLRLADTPVDLARVVGDCVEMMAGSAQAAGVALRQSPPSGPTRLLADARALRQVLINLLTNAVKFTPAGGRITVAIAGTADGGTCLSVADTGVGIAEEDLQRVREPFEQVADAYAPTHRGTGLGLTIAGALVDAHGGRLEIDSTPGEGTTVRVLFPAERTLAE